MSRESMGMLVKAMPFFFPLATREGPGPSSGSPLPLGLVTWLSSLSGAQVWQMLVPQRWPWSSPGAS